MDKKLWLVAALVALIAACGDDDKKSNNAANNTNNTNNTTGDMSLDQAPDLEQPADMGQDQSQVEDMEEDIATVGDVGIPDSDEACDVEALLTTEWPLHAAVSAGAVTVTSEGGVFTATIDASAGGSMMARNRPFVYLDLDGGGAKVAVSDADAFDNTDWDLAFRRTAIRTNSADSGPGALLVAKEIETTFEAVTAAPAFDAPDRWKTDTTVNAECEVELDPINIPMTAINYLNLFNPSGSRSWYNYGGTGGVVPLEGDIYLVKSASSDTVYKLEIQGWDSGVYTIRWAAL